MGWDEGFAKHYKNGKIDRKAECDARFTFKTEKQEVSVLKSSMVGSTYYAAVQIKTPEKTTVIGGVIRTGVRGPYIAMKVVEETCGPTERKCPKSIIKLLSPTESEYANKWRRDCLAYHDKKERERKDQFSLKNLPIGTTIDFIAPYDTSACKKGEHIFLEKKIVSWKYVWDKKTAQCVRKDRIAWSDGYYTWPDRYIPDDYRVQTETEIVDKQSRDMIYSGQWTA